MKNLIIIFIFGFFIFIVGFAIYKKINRVSVYNNDVPFERTFKINGHTYKEFYYKPNITNEPISIIHDPNCKCLNK